MTGKRRGLLPWIIAAAALAALGLFLLPRGGPEDGAGARPEGVRVLLDGEEARAGQTLSQGEDGLQVHITLEGEELLELPFGEEHTVRILLKDGGENTVTLTGGAVFMSEANCPGQDCVQMGEVTRENLETRVMGGFIICLPHRISVEVR